MANVLRLNYFVFIVLYYFYSKVETFSDGLLPNLNNMVEYTNQKPYHIQNLPPQYDRVAVDIKHSNPEDVSFPKLKKKKHKKKIHNKKINDNEVTEKVKPKKNKKKLTKKFMKTALDNKNEDNSMDSGEPNKRSPVDIIVHIKMNE